MNDWLKKNALTLGVALVPLVGAGFVTYHDVSDLQTKTTALETKLATVERDLAAKASREDLTGIRNALGRVQADIGLICAEMVQRRGGNPLKECRSAGGVK